MAAIHVDGFKALIPSTDCARKRYFRANPRQRGRRGGSIIVWARTKPCLMEEQTQQSIGTSQYRPSEETKQERSEKKELVCGES